jgi:hypothetical protein
MVLFMAIITTNSIDKTQFLLQNTRTLFGKQTLFTDYDQTYPPVNDVVKKPDKRSYKLPDFKISYFL